MATPGLLVWKEGTETVERFFISVNLLVMS
jgi:hypothetical protein